MLNTIKPLTKLEAEQLDKLRNYLKKLGSVCVAYSGGVDSSLVATIAKEQLGTKAIAVTGVSPALSPYLLKEARDQAKWIGIDHQECQTEELTNPAYNKNPINRCFACKQELHHQLRAIAKVSQTSQVVDGVNYDDLNDYRPGIEAARVAGVLSPLAELKINKISIRKISLALGLPWWNKAAQPCLASRFPYGESINEKKLDQVAHAEQWLINQGFHQVRVRSSGKEAKIELPEEHIDQLLLKLDKKKIVKYFLSLGFTSVSIDLEGLISGKLNRNLK